MSDLIGRQSAVDAICSECSGRCIPCESYPCGEVEALMKVPIMAETGRRIGEWIDDSDLPFDVGCRCSVCGTSGCASYWKYCPHCGSDNGGE